MKRHLWISAWTLAVVVLAWCVDWRPATARGDDPAPAPRTPLKVARMTDDDSRAVTDAAVRQALEHGNEFLIAQFKEGEITQGGDVSPAFRQGLNALCVYALLNSGQATRDPRLLPTSDFMRRLIDNMKLHPMATDREKPQSPVVYARSLRAAALALYARDEDIDVLRDDVQWLVDASVEGAYSYDDRFTYRVIADTSGNKEGRIGTPPRMSPVGPRARAPGGSPAATRQPTRPPGSPAAIPPGTWTRRPVSNWKPPGSIKMNPVRIGFPPVKLSTAFRPRMPNGPWSPPVKGTPTGGGGGVRRMAPPALPPPNYPPQELQDKNAGPFVWDNSNSQYGLMGVAAGADIGIEVPDQYFHEVEQHWLTYQLRTGEWCYRLDRTAGYLAMTCAGVASLMTTNDYLQAPYVARVGHQAGPVDDALGAAFDWLARGDNAVTVDGPQKVYVGYTLFGLERVGLATGYKYIGSHDWYPELARKVVLSQSPNGSWGKSQEPTSDTLIDTAYSILFLARGRHPVMMNKLQLDPPGKSDHGEWNNRPRDLANLARFTSRELERPVQWQVVPLDRDPADWSDAPILYLASHAALKLSDAEVAKIRAFIEAGGLLFTQADDGASAFNTWIDRLAQRLYPDRPLTDLPRDHDLYTLQYQIPLANRPRLRAMTDTAGRLVWIHSPTDLALSWQQRALVTKRTDFELGVNLFAYAVGKSDLRNRLEPRALPSPRLPSESPSLTLLRIKHDGLWNPSPLSFDRFSRWFGLETSLSLKPIETDIANLASATGDRKIAHLVLPASVSLSETQANALRQFVTNGGTLIVESPAATSPAAARPKTPARGDQLGSGLAKVFPDSTFKPVTEQHPLLNPTFPGMEKLWPLKLRPYTIKTMGEEIPPIRIAQVGKGIVVHLPLDISNGLAACAEWGVAGYEPATAQLLMKNLLLWSADRP